MAQSQGPKPLEGAVEQVAGKPPAPGQDYDALVGGRATLDAAGFAEHLATAIAMLTQQGGSGPKPVPPALQRQRAQAHAEMIELLDDLRERGELPLYKLRAPFFCDDVLIEEGKEIRFPDIPNEAMEPRNNVARSVMKLYMRWIGGRTPNLADQSYEAYLNRPRIAQVVGDPGFVNPLGKPGTMHGSRAQVVESEPDENTFGARARYVGPKRVFGTLPVERPS